MYALHLRTEIRAFKLPVRKLIKEIIMRYYYECEMNIVIKPHEAAAVQSGKYLRKEPEQSGGHAINSSWSRNEHVATCWQIRCKARLLQDLRGHTFLALKKVKGTQFHQDINKAICNILNRFMGKGRTCFMVQGTMQIAEQRDRKTQIFQWLQKTVLMLEFLLCALMNL